MRTFDFDRLFIQLQVWDAPGLKRLRTTVRGSYKSIAAALLVYDVTNRHSFESLHEWISELREECPNEDVILMLIGMRPEWIILVSLSSGSGQ